MRKLITIVSLLFVLQSSGQMIINSSPVIASVSSVAGFSRSITVDHTKVPNTNQTNFPVVFAGTYTYLKTVANGGKVTNSSGYDIIFSTDANGTSLLNWEIESWDAVTGAIVAWIKIPTLTTASDYVFYIRYGGTQSTFQGSVTGTWNSSYRMVQHFNNGTTLSLSDATSNAVNLTNVATHATATAGNIDGAVAFNGTNAELNAPTNFSIPITGTVSCWWKPGTDPTSTNSFLYHVYNFSTHNEFDLLVSSGTFYGGWYHYTAPINDDRATWAVTGLSSGTYYYVTLTWTNGGTTELRINGVSKATTSGLDATWATSGVSFNPEIGASINYYGLYSTLNLDELRFSSLALSSDWITTEYNNQSSPSTFYTIGSET